MQRLLGRPLLLLCTCAQQRSQQQTSWHSLLQYTVIVQLQLPGPAVQAVQQQQEVLLALAVMVVQDQVLRQLLLLGQQAQTAQRQRRRAMSGLVGTS